MMNRIFIFGAGRFGREIASTIMNQKTAEIIGFLDNYSQEEIVTVGGVGLPVYRPEHVKLSSFDCIVLALDMVDEAFAQLNDLGVGFYRINTSFIIKKGIGARDIFLEHFAKEIYRNKIQGAVAEAGVFKGQFSEKINRAFPDRKLYLFDTFEGFDERDFSGELEKGDNPLKAAEYFSQTSEKFVLGRLPHPENAIIKKGYVPDTFDGVDDEFCFVNLDMDLHDPTLAALEFFYDRVVDGGGILVHDFYNDYSFPNLKYGVIEFAKKNGLHYFPIGDGLSVFITK